MGVCSGQPVIDQLVAYYYLLDRFQGKHLSKEDVKNTLQILLNKGRILYELDEFEIIGGYVESWRINYTQLGRILCGQMFDIGIQDIETGPICYLANVTFHPSKQGNKEFFDALRIQFFKQNSTAEYFVGNAKRKNTGLWKAFKARDVHLEKWLIPHETAFATA